MNKLLHLKTVLLTAAFTGLFINNLFSQNVGSSVSPGDARHYNVKNSLWTEINLVGKIKGDFDWQLDFQYRRESDQAGYQKNPNMANIVKNGYQTVFRPWIHYYPKAFGRKLRFSISPIGYWGTFGIANTPGLTYNSGGPQTQTLETNEGELLYYPEIRSCYQVTTYDKIGRVSLAYRARLELRWIGSGSDQNGVSAPASTVAENNSGFGFGSGNFYHSVFKQRLRLFVRADIPLKGLTIDENEFYIAMFNEYWIGLGANTNNIGGFNQNRAYLALGYKFQGDIRLEVGYLNQLVPQSLNKGADGVTAENIDFNNVVHVNLVFDNFNKLFQTKEQKAATKLSKLENSKLSVLDRPANKTELGD
jgi:hypothetical protein